MPLHHAKSNDGIDRSVILPRGRLLAGSTTAGVIGTLGLSCVMVVAAISLYLVTSEKRNADRVATSIKAARRPVISGDLEAVNQDGEKATLSDLHGKVWAVAQFFAVCPICSRRNSKDLRSLAKRFADYPDFHLVCITVDPKSDGVEQLNGYAEAFGASSDKWWFLTGDHDEIHRYLEGDLLFPPVDERANEAEAAALGRFLHDLGITVVDWQMRIAGKRDLAWTASQSAQSRGGKPVRFTDEAGHCQDARPVNRMG